MFAAGDNVQISGRRAAWHGRGCVHPTTGKAGQPSDADIKVTRDLIRAGQLLKIEVLDHVIIGRPNHCSMRELGFFAV